ncbi:MAG: hypothetical protein GY757_47975 [bacterium]|nr:hypothetical protein [bacterium]
MLKKNSWDKWEQAVLEIFTRALTGLISRESLPVKEDDINRELAVKVRECRRAWCIENGKELQGHPVYQAKGQPSPLDKTKQSKENKIPEFIWSFSDYLNDLEKNYTVECKRLGADKYRYPEEYVKSGIKRFAEKEWSYGDGCESGLMIGYVQGREFEEILEWVNRYAAKHSVPSLKLKGQWNKKDVSRLENNLNRMWDSNPTFKLVHLWADFK